MRRPPKLLCYLLCFLQPLWVMGCSNDSIGGSGTGASSTLAGILANTNLGEAMFTLYRQQVELEPAGADRDARLAELDARHDPFVDAINRIVNQGTLPAQGVSQMIQAMYDLVDDGTLPTLADQMADALERLERDPAALDAIVNLLGSTDGPSTAQMDALVQLMGRMMNHPESADVILALARIVEENDGVDSATGFPNGEPRLVPDLLATLRDWLQSGQGVPQPSSALSQALADLGDSLTDEATIRGTLNTGPPAWVARVDTRGLPKVAIDPATGTVLPPFVDVDGDGLADTDPNDAFVDAVGLPIDQPTFGSGPGYDAEGRAVNAVGQPLFDYADAKRTVLAHTLSMLGQMIAKDVHGNARQVFEAGLGAPRPDGTYAPDGPVFDLLWGGLELMAPVEAQRALGAIARLIQTDPALFERIVVALARSLSASGQASVQTPIAGGQQLMDDLLVLFDDLFDQSGSGYEVTDTLADLSNQTPNFPAQLAPLFRYVRVEREQTPDADANDIDESRSQLVDRTQPTWIGAVDNRAAIHQLLDLFARADTCNLPLMNQSMAQVIIEMMADQSPATIEFLIPLLTALPGFLPNLFCAGISQDLASLDALARSGALDALLPLAKVFKDRGQVPLLIRLLNRVQVDYDGLMRPVEENVAAQLESGAYEDLFQAIDLARGVTDPVTGQRTSEALVDLFGALVDDDLTINDRNGNPVASRLHLVIGPMNDLDARLQAAGSGPLMDQLGGDLFDVLLERVTVGGQEQLRNGNLIPLLAEATDAFSKALPADAAQRRAEITDAQTELVDALSGQGFGQLVRLMRTIDTSPSRAVLNRALVSLFTPQQQQADDAFGEMARLAVMVLQDPPQGTVSGLQPLSSFVASLIDPSQTIVQDSIRAMEHLLTADGGQTLLGIGRAALNAPPGEVKAPITVLIEVLQSVSAAGSQAAYDRASLAADLRWLAALIRDDVDGLGWIFRLIRNREI